MVLPLGVSLIYGEGDAGAFFISIVLTSAIGLVLWARTRRSTDAITRREAFVIVTLVWFLGSAFAGLPYLLAGTFTNPFDAYFEAVSGFTTTGATVLADIEAQPQGVLFWRNFTQWLGGMGIIVLFVAVMPILGVGAVHMFEYEASGPTAERLTPRVRQTAKVLWIVYGSISAANLAVFLLLGLPPFEAVTHMFSTIATGGFSPLNRSLGAYDNAVLDFTTVFFMVAGGTNFGLYYFLWRGESRRVIVNREFRLYLIIVAGAAALVTFDLAINAGYRVFDGLRYGLFQTVSIQTGTGLVTANYDLWPPLSRGLLLVLMTIGPCAGSTGGAMKVIRVWIVVKYAYREVFRMFQPRAVLPLKVAGRQVSDRVVSETFGFLSLYLILLFGTTLFVAGFGFDLVTSFSAVAATLGTTGPGLGAVGPLSNYALLPNPVKLVLSFCMLVGRLEIWTVLVLLRPAFWTTK